MATCISAKDRITQHLMTVQRNCDAVTGGQEGAILTANKGNLRIVLLQSIRVPVLLPFRSKKLDKIYLVFVVGQKRVAVVISSAKTLFSIEPM